MSTWITKQAGALLRPHKSVCLKNQTGLAKWLRGWGCRHTTMTTKLDPWNPRQKERELSSDFYTLKHVYAHTQARAHTRAQAHTHTHKAKKTKTNKQTEQILFCCLRVIMLLQLKRSGICSRNWRCLREVLESQGGLELDSGDKQGGKSNRILNGGEGHGIRQARGTGRGAKDMWNAEQAV